MDPTKMTNRKRIMEALERKKVEDAARRRDMVAGKIAPKGPKPKKPKPDRAARCDRRAAARGRLPDGSAIAATYLAGRAVWLLQLTIPVIRCEDESDYTVLLTHAHPDLFRGLEELDGKYRDWLAQNAPEAKK